MSGRRRALLLVAGLAALLVALAAWLGLTQSGLRSTIGLVNRSGAASISHIGLEGRIGRFNADSLTVEAGATRLVLSQPRLHWHPVKLLRRKVSIESLDVATLKVATLADAAPTPDDGEAFSGKLPIDVELGNVRIAALSVDDKELASDIALQGSLERSALAHQINLAATVAEYGELTLSAAGDTRATRIEAAADALAASAGIELRDWTSNLAWTAQASIRDLSRFGANGVATLGGSGSLDAAQLAIDATLDGRVLSIDPVTVQRRDDGFDVRLASVFDDLPVTFAGQISAAGIDDGRIQINRFQPSQDLLIEALALTVGGQWDALALTGTARGRMIEPFSADFRGRLTPSSGVTLDEFIVQALGGSVEGTARASWIDTLAVGAALDLKQLNLSRLDPRLPQVSALAELAWSDDRLTGMLRDIAAQVSGSDVPVVGSGSFEMPVGGNLTAALALSAGAANRIDLDLRGGTADIDLDLRSVGAFVPGADGRASGALTLMLDDLSVTGELALAEIDLPDLVSVGRASLTASNDDGDQQLIINATALQGAGYQLGELQAKIDGKVEAHRFRLNATAEPEQSVQLAGSGRWASQRWAFALDTLQLDAAGAAAQLEQSVSGELAGDALTVEPICLNVEPDIGRACGAIGQTGDSVAGQFELRLVPDNALASLLAEQGLPVIDTAQGATATGRFTTRPLSLDLDATASTVNWRTVDGQSVSFRDFSLKAQTDGDQIGFNGQFGLDGGAVKAIGSIVDLADPRIEAQVTVTLPDLAKLSPLVSDADIQNGSVDARLNFSGPIDSPRIAGKLSATELRWIVPLLGVRQSGQIVMDLKGDAGRVSGFVESGAGRAELTGQFSVAPQLTLTLAVIGKRVLIADNEELAVAASPDLEIAWADDGLRIAGEIAIDEAFSTLALPANGGATRSGDVVVVDDEETGEAAAPLRAMIDIVTRFEQPGRIQGQGLNGTVTGRLRVTQQPGQPALGNGQLELTGEYRMLGQVLTIDSGRLIYANGALTDPTIEAYANREVDDVMVGVRISGKASSLQTTLESSPALPEADILHYLVLGRAPGSTTEFESDQLSAAALALALRTSKSGVQTFGERLGATELGLTQELGGLALAIGKQLSPKLYVGYTVGLLEPIDIARINYQLTRHWSLQAEISDESRAGVKYRIDKG